MAHQNRPLSEPTEKEAGSRKHDYSKMGLNWSGRREMETERPFPRQASSAVLKFERRHPFSPTVAPHITFPAAPTDRR